MYYDNPIDFDFKNTQKNFQYQQFIPDKEPSFLTSTFYNLGIIIAIFLICGGILYYRYNKKKKEQKLQKTFLKSGLFKKYLKTEIKKRRQMKKNIIKESIKKTEHIKPFNNDNYGNMFFM